jgi:SAM-dependent methyltransferase
VSAAEVLFAHVQGELDPSRRLMAILYRVLYRLGVTPWDHEEVPKPVKDLSDEWPSSPGRALDIGCGTGRDAVYLASRGWTVTGVDGVPQAVSAARRRAAAAGVDVTWILGDVTQLESLQLAGAYDLMLDRGCFHGLADAERDRCARGVTAAAAEGAELLMFAFQPRSRGAGPRGVTGEQLTRHFGDAWELVASEADTEAKLPRWLGNAQPVWYRFKHRD